MVPKTFDEFQAVMLKSINSFMKKPEHEVTDRNYLALILANQCLLAEMLGHIYLELTKNDIFKGGL